MRIERKLATLIAVLCGVLSAAGAAVAVAAGAGAVAAERTPLGTNWSGNSSRVRRTPQPQYHPDRHRVQEEVGAWKKAKWQEMQTTLRQEGYTENGTNNVECCPTVIEMVEPEGGRNERGLYVELYGDGENKQRFFEQSCRQDVVNRPCRFVDPRLLNQSLCIQKFSYTYALVRDSGAATEAPHRHRPRRGERHFPTLPGSGGWSLDYILVRSGCSCEIVPPPRKRKRQGGSHRHKRLSKIKRPEEDET